MPELTDLAIRRRIETCLSHWKVSGEIVVKRRAAEWVQQNLGNLTLRGFLKLLYDFVQTGGRISRVRERAAGYEQRYHYDVVLEVDGQPVYVEMVFTDEDRPNSQLCLVSIHEAD